MCAGAVLLLLLFGAAGQEPDFAELGPGGDHESGVRRLQYLLIPGKPVPKARHKIRLYGDRVLTYTPAKTQEYERAVRLYALDARLRKQKGELATLLIFHTSGPGDIDNFIKSVHDGLNGVAWEDDRQVEAVLAVKAPCQRGSEKTEVMIMSLEQFMVEFGRTLAELFRGGQWQQKGGAAE